ncbi:MAG: 4Fe-4S ferredoxin, partial [Candidatus Omnitrophica bacterium]|nr:4Fe-4S ferredoxin [Candidatus Omnitrophota bacterium]
IAYLKEKGIKNPLEKSTSKEHKHADTFSGCPGLKMMDFRREQNPAAEEKTVSGRMSQLRQWPIQIMLVPPFAPYLNNADVLIAADCVPFAYADFHEDLLREKVLLIGCPKLDDVEIYQQKLTQILKNNNIKSITYAHMEVPCCFGLVSIIQSAISTSGKDVPLKEAIISIKGKRLR